VYRVKGGNINFFRMERVSMRRQEKRNSSERGGFLDRAPGNIVLVNKI